MNGSASGEVLMSVMSHGNGLDASVATANARFKYFSFNSASVCVVFCLHDDRSWMKRDMETDKKGNFPFLLSSLRLCQPIFAVT